MADALQLFHRLRKPAKPRPWNLPVHTHNDDSDDLGERLGAHDRDGRGCGSERGRAASLFLDAAWPPGRGQARRTHTTFSSEI